MIADVCKKNVMVKNSDNIIKPLLHRYSFLRLQQTTFEAFQLKKNVHFSIVNIQDFSKYRLLQDCFMGEMVKERIDQVACI